MHQWLLGRLLQAYALQDLWRAHIRVTQQLGRHGLIIDCARYLFVLACSRCRTVNDLLHSEADDTTADLHSLGLVNFELDRVL